MSLPRPRPFNSDEPGATALAAVAATIAVWGFASPLIKAASVGGEAMAFYRLWIGAVALLAIVAGVLRRPVRAAVWPWGLVAGALFGVNLVFFVMSVKTTTVANATLIGALQPAIVLLVAGPLFGESVSPRDILCTAGAIAGVGIVIAGSAGTPEWHPAGDLLAVGAVLTFTVYFLVSKRVRATEQGGTLEYMTVVHLVAAIIATPAVAFRPGELVGLNTQDVLTILFFALVSGTLGQVVIGWAHLYVDVSVSSLLMLGVPVVASIAAWAMLDERLSPVQVGGGLLTLAAIGGMLWKRPAETRPLDESLTPVPAGTGGK